MSWWQRILEALGLAAVRVVEHKLEERAPGALGPKPITPERIADLRDRSARRREE